MQTDILFKLINVVERGIISENLFNPNVSNKEVVYKYIIELNSNAFTHLHKKQIESFTLALFNKAYSFVDFMNTIRDFLINLKSFSGYEEELFEHERKQELEESKKIEEKKRMNIPGLLPAYATSEQINTKDYMYDD